MPDNSSSNKRIAKNTLLLYGRMLFNMVVALYTSRVILAALGFEDYGLYNVVGGVVTMFTFINLAMGNASGRYITYALGKGNEKELHEVVSTAVMVHWVIAGIVVLLAETIGIWFLHNKLIIPEGRMYACEWVYQFSILACVVSIISLPYNSMVIAHEKMGVFAYISILIVSMKLLIAFLIQVLNGDRLIIYALLILLVGVLERILYQVYCLRHFPEAKHIRFKRYPQLREMLSFAGWKLMGNMMVILNTQGVNILLNIFFGPIVNAARGVVTQVESAVKGFVTNFQMAVQPQITKSYASDDIKRVQELIFLSSKLSLFLLLLFIVPIFIEAETILGIWLGEYPDHAPSFLRLLLLTLMIQPLENPIGIAKDSTGNIKNYSLVSSTLQASIIVLDYIALKLGCEPEIVFVIQIVMLTITLFAKFFMVRKEIQVSFLQYATQIIIRVILVAVIASILPVILFLTLKDGIVSFIIVIITAIMSVSLSSYVIGLNEHERASVTAIVKKAIGKKG